MKISEVFTPFDTPTITYVDRSEHKLEQRLKEYYDAPNLVISVSGPSKSGKTVLIRKVITPDNMIPVVGVGITSADNLWERVLNWMGTPEEVSTHQNTATELTIEAEAGGKLKVPLVAEGSTRLGLRGSRGSEKGSIELRRAQGITQVIKEIGGSDFVVFIDDFHYIKPEFREEIGRQIKVAAESGVKIITASVPHRADDVVRSNPELRGRVAAIDLSYWTENELTQIARKGFHALNIDLAPDVERRFALESFGSPQLMQSVCQNLCFDLSIASELPEQRRIDISSDQIEETLLRTSTTANFSKLLTALHTGPRTRGTERKIHPLVDGTQGDVYRAVLLAIKQSPAVLSFSYDNILSRVKSVCKDEVPVGSSITSSLEQMTLIGEEIQPGSSPISWDMDNLDIIDPYFLFYLRCSEKLQELGGAF